VPNGRRVEHAQVGHRPLDQQAAPVQAELPGPQPGCLADGLLPGEHLLLADIAPQQPREAAPGPGVLQPRRGAVVRADPDQRAGHDRPHVVLAHEPQHDRGRGVVGHQVAEGVPGVAAAGRLGQGAADHRRVAVAGQQHPVRVGLGPGAVADLAALGRGPQGRPGRRVAQLGPHRLGAAGGHGRGQQGAEHGRAGVVRVLVTLGVDPGQPGRGQPLQQPPGVSVGGRAGRLAVRHLEPGPGRPGDRHRLLEGRLEVRPLVAHVGGVGAAVGGRHPGQGDQLAGRGVAAGHVDQPAGEPDRPGLERLGGQGGHGLGRPGPQPLLQAVGGQPQGVVPDQQGQVVGRAGPVQAAGQLGEAGRLDRDAAGQAAPQGGRDLGRAGVQGGEGEPAVAHHLGGHALEELERLGLVAQVDQVGVGVGVDEPGGDGQPVAVDPSQPGRRVAADRDHPPPGHGHVRDPAGVAEPVVDGPALQQQPGAGHVGPVATGREGSATQSLQEPAYRAAGIPAASRARTRWAATTPEPQ
jgi:hypothetical protein